MLASGLEGWAELQAQREDGGKFVMDKIAARIHAGWAEAAHRVGGARERERERGKREEREG